MYDVMLDLETLDVKESAIVTAIGAVKYNPKNFEIKDTFHQKLKWVDQEEKGRTMSARTVLWWFGQSREAIIAMTENAADTVVGLENFSKWLFKDQGLDAFGLWGNGVDFDNVILASAYRSMGLDIPWSYRQNRCFRTFKNEFQGVAIPARVGTHHNALDDAITQMYHLKQIKEYIRNGNV